MSDTNSKPIVPEHFNLSEIIRGHDRSMLEHFFLRVMAAAAGEKSVLRVFGVEPGDVRLDVVLTINGVQAPVRSFVSLYQEQGDRMVNERAAELLSEKCGDIAGALYDLERSVKSKAAELFGVDR